VNTSRSRARVTLRPRRLRTIRFSLGATRWVLYTVAAVGIAATVRNGLDPPLRTVLETSTKPVSDARASWFAVSFARAYLTWSADPTMHQRELAAFIAPSVDTDAGLLPAPATAERVIWAGIAAEQGDQSAVTNYTVAVATAHTIRYLAVAVTRGAGGLPVLAHYPALVNAPAIDEASSLDGGSLPSVTNGAASAVLSRALSNYVNDSSQNLAADLAPGAQVDPPVSGLAARGVQRLALESSGVVLATVHATDPAGDLFTLAYQVSLIESHGRWEIARLGP
jgi:Conjugative transposon protein TcpC